MTFQSWRTFQPDVTGAPYGWIQWKGTSACLDFHCSCGAHGHVDAEFCYYVRCGTCGAVYELSGHVEARRLGPAEAPNLDPCDLCTEDE